MKTNSKKTAANPPTLAEQQQFWDWHWRNWRERRAINPWKEQRHDVLISLIRSLPLDRPRILDLGCGHGWFTGKLVDLGEVTGIDLSEEGIRMASRQHPHVTFIAGDLYTSPLPADYFDVVVTQEVIDHVEDQVAFVDRAARVLRSRGYFIVSCANKFVVDRLGDEFPEQPAEHIGAYLGLKDLKRLLSPRFKLLRARSILPVAGSRGLLRLVNSHKINTVLGWLTSPRHLAALKERAGFGYQLVALAQKRDG